MMEKRPPLTSPDGSSKRNPPERCPRPLNSRDSTQEDYSISEDDQVDEAKDFSENKSHEDSVISEDFEKEDLTVIKVEDLYDDEIKDDETCAVEGIPPEISTDRRYKRCKKKKLPFIAPDGKIKDYAMAADYTLVNPTSRNLHQEWHSAIEPFPPYTYEGRLTTPLTHRVPEGEDQAFLCSECGKCFSKQSSLDRHRQLMHTWEKPYSCSECGKRFGHKISLVRHQRIHNNENTFSCPLCGRCFAQKSHLVEHERQHTGEKPYVCTECGKRFAVKRALVSHESTHAGQKQFCCPECGKCFSRRAYLFSHQRVHLRPKMV
ncbi:oocyte zinc finger protein XlCOF6.1-like [Rana temporaria]|uniref:oocyte zinc finger protein XlCOF6.1-like n=1 Tax=Rana temporaria TaxID=8407 RepID=UPI001AACF3C8|nr:oocyte zinc finger protein XlCOF6.1-like [Rana temporaria]